MIKRIIIIPLLLLASELVAQPGALDLTFDPGTGANDVVRATAVQPDGKIIIGGQFTSYNGISRNYIARLNEDGTLDMSFDTGGVGVGPNGNVYAIAVQPDGKIIIGGSFTFFGSLSRNRIARLNADGTLDSFFLPLGGANGDIYAISILPDGKVIVGGSFTQYGGTPGFGNKIARLNATGSIDFSFEYGTGANAPIRAIALQSDGKIIIGGDFTSFDGEIKNRIARLNASGLLDVDFSIGAAANNSVLAIAVQPDDKVLAGGLFTFYNGSDRNRLARLDADGNLVTGFNPNPNGANSEIMAIALQSDGKIIVGGNFASYSLMVRNKIASLNADGTLASFNSTGASNGYVAAISTQPDGKIIIGGTFTLHNGISRNHIARLLAKQTQDIIFDALPSKTFGDPDFTLTATATSGLAVSYSSNNTSVATVNGSTVTITGTGTVTITASQAGNASYEAAVDYTQTFTVSKGNQNITFNALPPKTFSDPDFTLGATASSGLAVSYVSSNPSVATVSGNTVTLTGVGTTTITASQAGNINVHAASDVAQDLTVSKANQSITFDALSSKTFGDPNFTLGATASSGLAVSYSSSNHAVATISGSTITITGAGETTITASQTGSSNYNAAADIHRVLIVMPPADLSKPIVTDKTSETVVSGSAIMVTATLNDPESGIASANLLYRSVSTGDEFTSVAMNADTEDDYIRTIPASAVSELGVEYKFEITNGAGLKNEEVLYNVRVSMPGGGHTIPYTSYGSDVTSYRIVAVPLELTSNLVGDVFDELGTADNTEWRMFHYANGSNKELSSSSPIEPGKGYWLITKKSPGTIRSGPGITVQTSSASPYEIGLASGWNQIGNPYNFNISWADVQAANTGLSGLRKYEGDFADATVLNKMEGGFVHSSSARKLAIPVTQNDAANGRIKQETLPFRNPLSEKNWQVYLNISQGIRTNRTSGFGMHELASEGYDPFDGLTMPHFFDSWLEAKHIKKDDDLSFSKDIVPTSNDHVWEFFIESSSDESEMIFTWDNSYFGQTGPELYLWDVALQRAVDMREVSRYLFDKNRSTSFKVIYGASDLIKEMTLVKNPVFHGMWPNPANELATLSFSIPDENKSTVVSITITDALGRVVWQNDTLYSGGYHEVTWHREKRDTSGLYIVTLQAGRILATKRLIIK